MTARRPLNTLWLGLVALLAAGVVNDTGADALIELAKRAEASPEAARAMREQGPAGLASMRRVYADRADEPAVRGLVDAVAAQKDAHAAWLYWHTDLGEALARAQAEGKPVLSLRLLGGLDADLSCANSRFFRSVLYPDPEVNRRLAERFVLHWQSVRPVPVVTIDFGDGRVMRRSVVGNSVHLAIDRRGRVIDAMPGLVGAGTFAGWLDEAAELETATRAAPGEPVLAQWHAERRDRLAWYIQQRVEPSGLALPELAEGRPSAVAADRLAVSKSLISRPVLTAMGEPEIAALLAPGEVWPTLAAAFTEPSRLSPPVRRLVRAKHTAERSNRITRAKAVIADPMIRVFETLERNIALDTARNELDLHRRLHAWYAQGQIDPADIDGLVARIYEELFLAPIDDPWHGLAPTDAYAALDGGGHVVAGP